MAARAHESGKMLVRLDCCYFLPELLLKQLSLAGTSLLYKQLVHFDLLDLAKLFEFRDIDNRQIANYRD